MKRILAYFNLFLFFICCQVHGEIISGFVFDGKTQEALQYVNISYVGVNVGTSSDENGFFELPCIDDYKAVKVSSIGYVPIVLNIDTLNQNEVKIYLKPIAYPLSEFIIEGADIKTRDTHLGTYVKSRKSNFGWKIMVGYMSATYIENPQRATGIIKGVRVFFEYDKKKCNSFIRFRLLSHNGREFLPQDDILLDNLILHPKSKKDRYIDLLHYGIQMPRDGVWVCIEWMDNPTCIGSGNPSPFLRGHGLSDRVHSVTSFRDNGKWKPVDFSAITNLYVNPSIDIILEVPVEK